MTADQVATIATAISVDDDNTPAPENVPQANEQPTASIFGE